MVEPSRETIALASELIDSLAGNGLTPSFAKLYSHYTRLRENQPGLMSWSENEAKSRLNDVMRLVEAAYVQQEVRDEKWRKAMQRAGELLEWLSLSDLNADGLATRLLAAAAYQIAGYPARASGLLNEEATEGAESRILASLLKADFVSLFQRLAEYWSEILSTAQEESGSTSRTVETPKELHGLIVNETASAFGILCASLRWGNEPRLQKALDKLSAVGKVLIHSYNPYSWLLAKFCAEVASTYTNSSMRYSLQELLQGINQSGREVIERYLRQSFQTGKTLAWPSQIRGIEQLATRQSFTLCTPTGSGKTTVAELAILQSLFFNSDSSDEIASGAPLVIYLVPSKALATEIESKLSRLLRRTTTPSEQVIVTGLYGGTDWGPTDAWLTSEERTVLICTYEKAEALMKFLGPFFIRRISLVVIDEAHTVQFSGSRESLQKAESRALRLEALGARLFSYLNQERSRIIALSAVASEAEGALARWIARRIDVSPVKTSYKSTRQLIGRLECQLGRGFEIRYDLLDGARLEFREMQGTDGPYIPNPFPRHPPAVKFEREQTPGKRLRPYLFWAAMHLAAPDDRGQQRAVLISITQHIGGYAEDFLKLLNSTWAKVKKPAFFQPPSAPEKVGVWQKCLRSCEDYFGQTSREYQLLEKGIVVHHGKMPGLMARLLIELVEEKIVNLVLATSTLSEGVNLPFETVLIPSLQRYDADLDGREFSNLVGRAGRPGFGTEGRSLVLLIDEQPGDWRVREARNLYFALINTLAEQRETNDHNSGAISPLAELLTYLEEQWCRLSRSNNHEEFLNWLERTAPLNINLNDDNDAELAAIEALDTLDSILLSAIVETEQLANQNLSPDDLEEQLRRIWQQTYAHYASQEQARLEELFIRRGQALRTSIYSNYGERRRLYRTSLPPRSGNQLLALYQPIKQHLITGREYAEWSFEERFNYIQNTVIYLNELPKFRLSQTTGKQNQGISWNMILHWWLCHRQSHNQPSKTQVSTWHDYISKNFNYRFNWGLGSIVALAIDEAFGGELFEPSLEDWPRTGLPWIVFWMKELIVWGTLDPVAAYLLARIDGVTTRIKAEELAQTYYEQVGNQEPNERLNPITIKNWAQQSFSNIEQTTSKHRPSKRLQVELLRDFSRVSNKNWRVIPVEVGNEVNWIDPAGFPLAKCQKPENWQSDYLKTYDFMLDASQAIVSSRAYI